MQRFLPFLVGVVLVYLMAWVSGGDPFTRGTSAGVTLAASWFVGVIFTLVWMMTEKGDDL